MLAEPYDASKCSTNQFVLADQGLFRGMSHARSH